MGPDRTDVRRTQGESAVIRFTSAPETLPEADDPGFDGANWGAIRTINDGTQTENTTFLRLENGVLSVVGDAFFLGGGEVQKTYYTGPRPVFVFPLAYEDTWTYDGQMTYSFAPNGEYETVHEVDA